MEVRSVADDDAGWVRWVLDERWGGQTMVARMTVYRPAEYPGFVAVEDEERVGLATYRVDGDLCEVMVIESLPPGRGSGTALIEAVADAARSVGCTGLRAVTTNDNESAQGFYERLGFRVVAVRGGAVTEARRTLKPTIPELGENGVPIEDEIEYELAL